MKKVAGVWLPDKEAHLLPFLEDPATQIDGVGTYQLKKLRAALLYVPERRVAIDVGAHVGLWSMQLVKQFQQVFAFEPVIEHITCLVRNVPQTEPAFKVFPYALGNYDGGVKMEPESDESSGGYHVQARLAVGDEFNATIRRLDGFADEWPAVDFLKIDVEGFELFVLEGGEKTIRTHRPVICIEQKPKRKPGDRADRYRVETMDAVRRLQTWKYQVREALSGDYILTGR